MDHIQKKENSNFEKVAVRFIAEESASKKGTCAKCQQYSGKIYFLLPDGTHNGPRLPLHPNCRCHYQYLTALELKEDPNKKKDSKSFWEKLAEELGIPYFDTSKGNTVHMRVKGSPGAFRTSSFSFGDIEFNGFDDMISKLKENCSSRKIDKLIISNHGRLEGSYPLGNDDDLGKLLDPQINKLKQFLHSDSIVDIRMCCTSGGKLGEEAAQRLANRLNCKVVGYGGLVTYYGTSALVSLDEEPPYVLFDTKKSKIYYPQLEKGK